MTVTFFGHRHTPCPIRMPLKNLLIDLIERKNADCFYVGNHGAFDSMVCQTLKELKEIYPHITYYIALAYLPSKSQYEDNMDYSCTIYPDGLENTPRKFAIVKRNQWMIEKADVVITYVEVSFGGAAQFKALAERKGKIVINLAG